MTKVSNLFWQGILALALAFALLHFIDGADADASDKRALHERFPAEKVVELVKSRIAKFPGRDWECMATEEGVYCCYRPYVVFTHPTLGEICVIPEGSPGAGKDMMPIFVSRYGGDK